MVTAMNPLTLNSNDVEHILQCDICNETYNDTNRQPKLLSCGHTFCKSCLLAISPPLCPMDRRPFNSGNINNLPNNPSIMYLLQVNQRRQQRAPIPPISQQNTTSTFHGLSPFQNQFINEIISENNPVNVNQFNVHADNQHIIPPDIERHACTIHVDKRYYKGLLGLLKFIETVCCIIAFSCVEASGTKCDVSSTVFFLIITMFNCTMTLFLFTILLLGVYRQIFGCHCINWPFMEGVIYVCLLIPLFFGCLFMAGGACHPAHTAGVFFGFAAIVPYAVDCTLCFLTYWKRRQPQIQDFTRT